MEKITTKKFQIPKKLIHDLYEASGGPDRYKGYIIVVSDEHGNPTILSEAESGIIHFGLLKGLEKWLTEQVFEE